ncbi:MAG TPA: hypothetical protein ENN44_07810 [Methanoculleus sp.]|nr:hypothetical protein [Methanoculleus sp.]
MKGMLLMTLGVLLVLAVVACGCTDSATGPELTAPFDEGYRANEKTVLAVENPCGPVTITRGDVKEVVLHAVKRTRAGEEELEKVEITGTKGSLLKIRARWTTVLPPRVTVDMAITVPPYVTVDAVTVSNGDVRIDGVAGDVAVSCFNCDVLITNMSGSVTAAVENGNITVRDTTGTGDLTVRNGWIDAEVRSVRGNVAIEAKNGNITLALGPALNAALAVTTKNGAVSVEGLPLEVTAATMTAVDGVLGAGGPVIAVDATSGDVHITSL